MLQRHFARSFLSEGASSQRGAFTLVEIIIVVLLVGILAAAGMPAIGAAATDMKLRAAARKLTAGLNYIRNQAITEGAEYGIVCSAAGYKAFKPGDGLEAITHPLTHQAWVVDLSDDHIALAADFSDESKVTFDSTGAPSSAGQIVMTLGKISTTLTVEASTGRVSASQ
jgi:prepilin-type N-terminal cleavage/methylation domain-containing protein